MWRKSDSVEGMFLSVSTQAVAVTSQRPSRMRSWISFIISGSYSSTMRYTLACDCEKVKCGYSRIRSSMVRNVASAAPTVSCQVHIQFMSMCACAAQRISYSLAALEMGKSASSACMAAWREMAPSVCSAFSITRRLSSINASNSPCRSPES